MPRVMLTARVTDAQAAALKSYAGEVGLPLYQATVRALELGIAALIGGRGIEAVQSASASSEGIEISQLEALQEAVDRLSTRAELTDRLVQRTLYASCASYAAALAEPGESPERLAVIVRDADRIFDRQLAKAREGMA